MPEDERTADERIAERLISSVEARTSVHDLSFEGARQRWRRVGTGPDLVLVHGGQGSWLHWVRNIDALSPSFTLWLPDLPGLGESDPVPELSSLERLVQALRSGVDTLIGPQRDICLAAFSFGAALAAGMAVLRGHVSRFAMIGGTAHALPRRSVDLKKWRHLPEGPEQDEAHRYNLSQQMLHDPSAIDTLALRVHRQSMQRTRLRSRLISRSSATRDALDQLSIPILMVWGEHDPTALGEQTARSLTEGHPNRRSLVTRGAGHWLQYERPAEVNALLQGWFS
jgi:pimeloyl-ACP methyl ester carboxylesterase